MRILFMGTPQFAVPSLKILIENFQVVGVVAQPDKPAGRGQKLTPPPTKLLALEYSIEVYQPTKKSELIGIVREKKPDCIVVVAYGKILPPEVISYPTYGCINLHASLLPKYRGSAPIQRAIMNSEKITGNTVMLMDEGMDTGPILSYEEEVITDEDNAVSLAERLSVKGANLLLKTIKDWFEGRIEPIPQDHSQATYAPPILKEEYRICWKAGAQSIHDRIRGLYPNCYALLPDGQRVKILRTRPVEGEGEPGEVLDKKRFIVACGKGALEILELINPKGKRISGEEFMRSYKFDNLPLAKVEGPSEEGKG